MPAIREERLDLTDLLQGPPAITADLFVTEGSSVQAQLVVPCRNVLGEGVIYDDQIHAVVWTDIMGCTLHKLQLPIALGGEVNASTMASFSTYEMPQPVGSIGLIDATANYETMKTTIDSWPLLVAWSDGFSLYNVEQERSMLPERSVGEDVNPAKGPTRLNDGRVDPTGRRFICGGYYGEQAGTKMKVFKVEQNQQDGKIYHEAILDDMEVTNSIAWSNDGTIMYLADSPTNQIYQYDYNLETGQVSNKRLLHTKSDPEQGFPDGTCVDSEGYLWNAVWRSGAGPGMVQRIHPTTGNVVFTVHMPDTTSQVTCCCFGGPALDILFITTAAENRPDQVEPQSGGLYAVKLPVRGRPEARLQFRA